MKTIQKLEVFSGIATFVATLVFIYYVDFPLQKKIAENNREIFEYSWTNPSLLVISSLLIVVGSYLHAFKQSTIGLGVIMVLGGIMSFLYTIGFLVGSAFEGHHLIGVLPGFFAFMTMVLALANNFKFWEGLD